MRAEIATFNGATFRRYPDSKRRTDRVYFTPNGTHRAKGMRRLHEEIWKSIHGPIPEGYHVHHADHDPLNNDPTNLVCIPARDHHQHHAPDLAEFRQSDEWQGHLDDIRPLAAAWHSSPEGRAWHSKHAAMQAALREPTERTCDRCGKTYMRAGITGRFCSNACKAAFRRASGVDDVTKTCPVCGQDFTASRYKKNPTCSRRCGNRLRHLA